MKKSSYIILGIMLFGAFFLAPQLVNPVVAKTSAASTFHVELWYDNSGHYGDTEDDVATLFKTQLTDTGYFDVELKSTDWTTYKSYRNAGTMPIYLMGWWFDFPDESNYIDPFVGNNAFFPGALNDSTMNGYVKTMSESSDPAVRATAQKNAQKLLATEASLIPLFTMTNQFVVYGSDMTGVVLEPSENIHYASIKKGSTVGPITVGTTDSIPALDFANVYEFFASNTLFQTSYGLFQLPVDGTQAEPVVVNSYSISPDGLTYVFNISTGLHFTDGSPLTVEDYIWSLTRSTSLSGEPSGLVNSIDNNTIAKVNNTALTFDLKQKDGILLQKMTYSNSYVWKMDNTGNITSTLQGQNYIPVGLGPYKISSWVPNEELVLTAVDTGNEALLGTQVPQNTQVTIKFYTTSSSLKTDVQSGAVDVGFHTFSSDEITALQADTNLKTATKDTAGVRYAIINVDTINNTAIRQALALSVDRSEFVSTIFNNKNSELYSMVSPIFNNACKKGDDCAFPGQNLDKVAELMTAQGYGSSATTATSTPGFEAIALVVSLSAISAIFMKKRKYN
jgi:ABC-type transport system substrate-binding protein